MKKLYSLSDIIIPYLDYSLLKNHSADIGKMVKKSPGTRR